MASIGHVAVGLAAWRWRGRPGPAWVRVVMAAGWVALALLPDADVIAFVFRIPYQAAFGHRGAAHSLAASVLCGLVALCAPRARGRTSFTTAAMVAAVVASHGVLDTLTDGGLGVALLWPVSDARFFAPWRPIPVAPIGAGLFCERGLYVFAVETLQFLPLLLYGLWPRSAAPTATEGRRL